MSGRDVILDRIKSDCDESIKKIDADAEKVCEQIFSESKLQAEKAALEIAKKAELKVKQINASSKSRAELEIRNALLKKRRCEIDITVSKLLDYLLGLDDGEYFEIIYRLASKLGGNNGEILLNSKDIARLPSDFEEKLSKSGLNAVVCKTAADISGGFILKSGDIEENMDFAALISEKSDELEDLINRGLFSE